MLVFNSMLIFDTALGLFILFTVYFFIFPLSKKRPVLIMHWGLVLYSIVLVMALYPLLQLEIFGIVAALFMILLLFFRLWFVYGITGTMISDALEKAALATRAPIEKTSENYKIDNNLKVILHQIFGKVYVVSFKKVGESKKANLTKVVFKKFMQNYFV